jgi:hypothetical protein
MVTVRQYYGDSTTVLWWRYDNTTVTVGHYYGDGTTVRLWQYELSPSCFDIVLSYCHHRTAALLPSYCRTVTIVLSCFALFVLRDIQVFSLNTVFIFIEWYENKHFTSRCSHKRNMIIFISQDENKSSIFRKNLQNIFFSIYLTGQQFPYISNWSADSTILLQIPPEACTSRRRHTAGQGQVILSTRGDWLTCRD